MAQFYQRFLKVLQNWPADETKLSKTLGVYLRERGRQAFDKHGEFKGNQQDCERRIASLERIARNHWASKYPRSRSSSATGLTAEHCNVALRRETVYELEEYAKLGYVDRWLVDKFGTTPIYRWFQDKFGKLFIFRQRQDRFQK